MGLQEATMRAAVADLVPTTGRGVAYGIFNAVYGFGLLIGAVVIGAISAHALGWLILYVCATQLVALGALIAMLNAQRE